MCLQETGGLGVDCIIDNGGEGGEGREGRGGEGGEYNGGVSAGNWRSGSGLYHRQWW